MPTGGTGNLRSSCLYEVPRFQGQSTWSVGTGFCRLAKQRKPSCDLDGDPHTVGTPLPEPEFALPDLLDPLLRPSEPKRRVSDLPSPIGRNSSKDAAAAFLHGFRLLMEGRPAEVRSANRRVSTGNGCGRNACASSGRIAVRVELCEGSQDAEQVGERAVGACPPSAQAAHWKWSYWHHLAKRNYPDNQGVLEKGTLREGMTKPQAKEFFVFHPDGSPSMYVGS